MTACWYASIAVFKAAFEDEKMKIVPDLAEELSVSSMSVIRILSDDKLYKTKKFAECVNNFWTR